MAMLSSMAWVVHDVGLATAIGGTLFGRTALEPALDEIERPEERDRVSADAWQRFSLVNFAAHAAFAASWFFGRGMLSGREVSRAARVLTTVKDGLVAASLITGVTSMLLGRRLGMRARRGEGPEQVRVEHREGAEARRTQVIDRTVGGLGIANLLTNIGIAGVTKLLAMEASQSARFAVRSRRLP